MADLHPHEGAVQRGGLKDEDVVGHSDVVDGTTLQRILAGEGKQLPPEVEENLKYYDYFVFRFKIGAKKPAKYKGVDSIHMDFEFDADGVFDIEDGLPKAEWAATGFSADIDVALTFKGGIHFRNAKDVPSNPPGPAPTPAPTPAPSPAPTPTPSPGPGGEVGIDTGIRMHYRFAPEIQVVRPVFAGRSCQLVVRAKPGKSVDMQDIVLVAKLDKTITSVKFLLRNFRAVYRLGPVFTDTVIVKDMDMSKVRVDLRR